MSQLSEFFNDVTGRTALREAKKSSASQREMAELMAGQYAQLMPQLTSLWQGLATDPNSSPWLRAQRNQTDAAYDRQLKQAGQALQQSLRAKGLGGSYLGNALTTLAAHGADQKQQTRAGQLGTSLDALRSLSGLISPLGATAANEYGQMANQNYAMASQQMQPFYYALKLLLNPIASAAGQGIVKGVKAAFN